MEAVEIALALGGLVDAGTLRVNIGRKGIRRALVAGEIVRVGRGRYGLPSTDRARERAREVNGFLILESAALHWGWEVRMPPEEPQVAVPRGRPSTDAVVRRLRSSDLDGWATTKVKTAVMCAAELPFPDALAIVDSALRHRDVTLSSLQAAVSGLRGEHGRRARRVINLADSRPANPFESALRACAIEAGLDVVPQFRMTLGDLVAHPDLANPILGIAIEAESWEFHGRLRADFNRDCERYSQMTALGWRVLRFTWADVMFRPETVVATIRATAELARACAC